MGELGTHLTQMRPTPKPASIPKRLTTIDMGLKLGEAVLPFFLGVKLSSHLTQCGLGLSILSFIWVHPNVWPQYTNVRDRQDRQTGRQNRQRTDR